MKAHLVRIFSTIQVAVAAIACFGQNQFTANLFGQTRLIATVANPNTPENVTIGPLWTNNSVLRVSGHLMNSPTYVYDEFTFPSICTFRTDALEGDNQNWSMTKFDPDLSSFFEIGRLWRTNPDNAFNVGARQGDGNLWLRNSDNDGFRLNFNGVSGTLLNGFNLNRQAYAALGSENAINTQLSVTGPNAPWSRFHLVHPSQGASPAYGAFRDWQTNGITFTGNSDWGYIGQKFDLDHNEEQDDNSDMVAAWYDDRQPEGPTPRWNNFTFRFLGDLGAGGSAGTNDGLEFLRMRPYRDNAQDPIQGYVGVGDWVNAGALPTQRFDILDGKMRHRQLPNDAPMLLVDKVMVVDPTGIVGWRPASGLGGATCDWSIAPGATNNHVSTAYAPAVADCPDIAEAVGIGLNLTGVAPAKFVLQTATLPMG